MATPAQVLKDPKFYGLPLEEQKKVLLKIDPNYAKLPPQEQYKVLALGRSRMPATSGPDSIGTGEKPGALSRFVTAAVAPIQGAVQGVVSAIADPPTAEEAGASLVPGGVAAKRLFLDPQIQQGQEAYQDFKQGRYSEAAGHGIAAALPLFGPWAANVAESEGKELGSGDYASAAGTLAGNAVVAVAPKIVGRGTQALMDVSRKARVGLVPIAQAVTGVSPKVAATVAGETADANVKATDSFNKDAEEHRQEAIDAAHETAGREIEHQIKVKAANDAAREANAALDKEHEKAIQDALHENEGKETGYKVELNKAKLESEEAYRKKLAEVTEKRNKAESARKEELRKYLAAKEKIKADNEAAQKQFESDRAAQKKIQPTAQKLKMAWGNLRAKIETAREKALVEGNKKYSGVNSAMSGVESDPEFIGTALGNAETSLRGSTQDTTLLKNMTREYLGDGKEDSGRVPTYSDLQGEYSRLGNEISKGSLPGDVYKAYDNLHEAIGNEMQRLADQEGQGEQLSAARNYWRRTKQTFGKPFSPRDVASGVLRDAGSGLAEEDALQNHLRLLGSFNPDIPKQFAHVDNIEKGLKALPKPLPARELTQRLVDSRKPAPQPPKRGEAVPDPEQVEPKPVAPPKATEYPDRPTPVSPETPVPPNRVLPKDRPIEPTPKKVNTEDLRSANEEQVRKSADWIRRRANTLATYVTGFEAVVQLSRAITSGDLSELARLPQDALQGVGILAAGHGLAAFLESPKVIKLLTEPTAKQIAEIPPELRGDLKPVVDAARKQGIKVDPRIYALVGGTVGPKTKQLQDMRKSR